MAVDEFVSRLKAALSELISSDTAKSPVLGEDIHTGGAPSTPAPMALRAFSKEMSVCSRQGSSVPSAFGEGTVMESASASKSVSGKPGKNLRRSCGGF